MISIIASVTVYFPDVDPANLPFEFESQFVITLAAEAQVDPADITFGGMFPGSIVVAATVLFTDFDDSLYARVEKFLETMQCCARDVFYVNPFFDLYGEAELRSSSISGVASRQTPPSPQLDENENPDNPVYEQYWFWAILAMVTTVYSVSCCCLMYYRRANKNFEKQVELQISTPGPVSRALTGNQVAPVNETPIRPPPPAGTLPETPTATGADATQT